MMIYHDVLTVSEQESANRQAIRALRKRLELQKPQADDYRTSENNHAARAVGAALNWSKFAVVVIALAAGLASAIRNVSAVYQNYTLAGTKPTVAVLAAVAFVLSVECAVFVVALARAGVEMQKRAESKPRHVTSLRTIYRALQVRLGTAEPLTYEQLPERDNLALVLWLAFGFAIVANLAVAMQPVLSSTEQSLQVYLGSLSDAPSSMQMAFVLDVALAMLPPALALVDGELTARFAREYAEQGESGKTAHLADLETWRSAWSNPLSTEEGTEYLHALLAEKTRRKLERMGEPIPPELEQASNPFAMTRSNGNGKR